MGKEKNRPPEFASDWHYERHLADLERELAGRQARLAELKTLDTTPSALAQAKAEVQAVRDQLAHYGAGQESASRRPAGKGEKR